MRSFDSLTLGFIYIVSHDNESRCIMFFCFRSCYAVLLRFLPCFVFYPPCSIITITIAGTIIIIITIWEFMQISLLQQKKTTRYNTPQYDTTQHNTIHTTQYNITQHYTTLYNIIQHNTIQHNTKQHNIIQHNTHNITHHYTT